MRDRKGGAARSGSFLDHPPGRATTVACCLLLAAIWGTTWAAIRIGLGGIPPFLGVSLRFVIAALLLFGLAGLLRVRAGAARHERLLWGVHGVSAFCISYGVTYWVEQYVPTGLTSVLFASFPLFVALFAALLLPGERLSCVAAGGLVLGFAGVATIFSQDFALLGGREVLVASAVMLLSPTSAALGNVIVKRWGGATHPVSLNAGAMALAAVLMGVLSAAVERERTVVFDLPSVLALVYLAVVGSAVTFTLYFWLLKHVPATRVALIAYLVPVVAIALGVAAFDEPITARMLAGTGLVLGGVALASR